MKILAIEHEFSGAAPEAFQRYARAEAAQAWQLYRQGVIRELHFRADRPQAVLTLECDDVEAARRALATLPLVANGLISFELIPLAPYPGFERLFAVSLRTP
jgi:muconolactone delta-isomerase